MTAINELFKKQGLNDEQLMRILLTPEGANFLRQGSLTGASRKTLDALTNIPTALEAGTPGFSAASRLIPSEQAPTAQQPAAAQQPEEQQFQMPPEFQQEGQQPTQQPATEQQWQMPPDLIQQPSANDLTSQDQSQILSILGASPRPSPMSGMNPQLQMR